MKFRFIWIGKTRDSDWLALQEEYLGRLSRFVKCSIVELKDKGPRESLENEGERILDKANQSSFLCLLDVKGRAMGSRRLARQVEKWQISGGIKEISFVIGGARGVSSAVVEKADFSLSLSLLTFTHEMARVILLEQLYRSFTIIKGYPYQK